MRPPFPRTIDSTTIKTFRECPRKYELEYLRHWKSKEPSVHLHAGAAFASGLEETRRAFYERKLSPDDALATGIQTLLTEYGAFPCPPESAKSAQRMAGALEFYFNHYPMPQDQLQPIEWSPGKFGIEYTFAVPLPFDHPETGEPLTYTGRADLLGSYNGGLFVCDEKTTTSLGASWINQWDMRSQFTGYAWASRQAGRPVDGVLVRGVSILKTKYDTLQAITYRPDWQIERWLKQVLRDLSRMEEMWREGYFDYNLDEACNGYSGCLFRRVCLSPEPETWLPAYYERRVWDPLAHKELPYVEPV
jgi:hypothetical protein